MSLRSVGRDMKLNQQLLMVSSNEWKTTSQARMITVSGVTTAPADLATQGAREGLVPLCQPHPPKFFFTA